MAFPGNPFRIERDWYFCGLHCVVVIPREGYSRCGYVRVPETHPLYCVHYDQPDIYVHGGLTFSRLEMVGEDDGLGWWFGFDCAHAGDAYCLPDSPEGVKLRAVGVHSLMEGEFRSEEYVAAQCETLATQLWAYAKVTAAALNE